MKKEYVKPQMEIVEMEMYQPLLVDSVKGAIGVSRKRYTSPLWDDDDEEIE